MADTVRGVDYDDLPALLKAYEAAEATAEQTYNDWRVADSAATTARNAHSQAKTIARDLWEAIEDHRKRKAHL